VLDRVLRDLSDHECKCRARLLHNHLAGIQPQAEECEWGYGGDDAEAEESGHRKKGMLLIN
jgi:hypothetical protein